MDIKVVQVLTRGTDDDWRYELLVVHFWIDCDGVVGKSQFPSYDCCLMDSKLAGLKQPLRLGGRRLNRLASTFETPVASFNNVIAEMQSSVAPNPAAEPIGPTFDLPGKYLTGNNMGGS